MKMNQMVTVFGIAMLSAMPVIAKAGESITGRIIGHDCAHKAELCPIDKLDPHITLERDFVLVSGGDYYFLPNLPRDTKVRYVLDTVTVTGDVDKKHGAIRVQELTVSQNGKKKVAWSPSMQRHAWGRLPGDA